MDFRAPAVDGGGVIIIIIILLLLFASGLLCLLVGGGEAGVIAASPAPSLYGPLASPSASAASNTTVVDLEIVDRGDETCEPNDLADGDWSDGDDCGGGGGGDGDESAVGCAADAAGAAATVLRLRVKRMPASQYDAVKDYLR